MDWSVSVETGVGGCGVEETVGAGGRGSRSSERKRASSKKERKKERKKKSTTSPVRLFAVQFLAYLFLRSCSLLLLLLHTRQHRQHHKRDPQRVKAGEDFINMEDWWAFEGEVSVEEGIHGRGERESERASEASFLSSFFSVSSHRASISSSPDFISTSSRRLLTGSNINRHFFFGGGGSSTISKKRFPPLNSSLFRCNITCTFETLLLCSK